MCGIVAYSGDSNRLLDTLIDGLKRLEYRGYDSAGVALFTNSKPAELYLKKVAGKISQLESAIKMQPPTGFGNVGIAHTRWATHGQATVQNAHPHLSANGNIGLVHNGIIENSAVLKKHLQNQGITFQGETDSEVIAKLIGTKYKGDLRTAVQSAVKMLRGSFALCVICKDEPDRLIGVKMESPIVAGIGGQEIILASDVSAVIGITRKVIYLNDKEIVDIKGESYGIYDFAGKQVAAKIKNIDWDIESANKGGYEHYLLKEIMEQPADIRETIRGRIDNTYGLITFTEAKEMNHIAKQADRIILLGVGTSYYAANLGELYFNALTGLPSESFMSPEFRYTTNPIDNHTWVIAISQSGETADTLAAVKEAKRKGAFVTAIVNVVGSTLSRIADVSIYNNIGPEISVASTKAFTSQILLLLIISLAIHDKSIDNGEVRDILNSIASIPSDIDNLLSDRHKIEEIAARFHLSENMLYIGRQYNYPIAQEGALKMKELAYVQAEGLSGGELKHGFIALVDKDLPTVAIVTDDSVTDKMLSNIAEIKARSGKIIGIANHSYNEFDYNIVVPRVDSIYLQPVVNVIALQLLAYYSAKVRSLNIDQPRNLAKSVTVE